MKDFLHYLRKNRLSYLVSILVLVVTFIISTLSFLTYNIAGNTSQNMEDKVQIVGYIESGESSYYKDTVIEELEELSNVEGITYKESQEELEGFLEDLDVGGELFEDVLDDNPLEDTLYIQLKDNSQIEETYNKILELDHFDEDNVLYNQEGVEIVENLTVMFYVVVITLIVVVGAITVPIINILIKNSIDSRSSEIRVKRLIGAKKVSIVAPILVELLIMLIISILLYGVVAYYLLIFIRDTINSFGVNLIEIGSLQEIFLNSFGVNILFGIIITISTLMYVVINKMKV